MLGYPFFFRPRPPALPALRAISLRCSGVRFFDRFLPPCFPNARKISATSAGIFFLAIS